MDGRPSHVLEQEISVFRICDWLCEKSGQGEPWRRATGLGRYKQTGASSVSDGD